MPMTVRMAVITRATDRGRPVDGCRKGEDVDGQDVFPMTQESLATMLSVR